MSILTVTFISFYALGFWSLQQYGSLCYEVHQTIYERVFVQTAFQQQIYPSNREEPCVVLVRVDSAPRFFGFSNGKSLLQLWLVVSPSLSHQGSLSDATLHEHPFH